MAHGTQLKRAGTAIAEVVSISDVSYFVDEIDVTNTDSGGIYEKKPGLKGAGDVTLECNMRLDDTTGQVQAYTDAAAKTISSYTIEGPSTAAFSWTFDGFVKEFATITPVAASEIAKVRITFCITGGATFAVTASSDVTTIACGTGTMSPAWVATKYLYSLQLGASTSSTFTVTEASSTLKLYKSGVYVATLTTTEASAAVPFDIGTTEIAISTQEVGKVPKWYKIYVSRDS
jgi:hypothetical protein